MDAYTGDMTFYVTDPTDPIIRTYEKIFPTLFTPLDQMPADLQAHLRVPEELFNVQTRTYARYHVTDPAAFYNNEDLWTVPADSPAARACPTRPTTSSCGCPASRSPSSCCSSRWSRARGRT